MMETSHLLIASVVSIVVGIILVALLEYNLRDWKSITLNKGEKMYIPTKSGVHNLRFRRGYFGVTLPNGDSKVLDVTGNLNAMASAYDATNAPLAFQLVGPLDAFSFKIPGFNDTATTTTLPTWAAANVKLTLQYYEVASKE